jgi:hypothetical protein
VQVPVPLHPAPLQPVKLLPPLATAVSVTCAPTPKSAVHVLGQLMPAGALVTTPNPVPLVVTVSGKEVAGVTVNDAVPCFPPDAAVIVTGPPVVTPVASPAVTVAIPALEEVQLALLVRS